MTTQYNLSTYITDFDVLVSLSCSTMRNSVEES